MNEFEPWERHNSGIKSRGVLEIVPQNNLSLGSTFIVNCYDGGMLEFSVSFDELRDALRLASLHCPFERRFNKSIEVLDKNNKIIV